MKLKPKNMTNKDFRLPWWWSVILILTLIAKCKVNASYPRIQRRFMWKQMDDTMDGLFDTMALSARAMKNMFGDFMPSMTTAATPLLMHGNVLDFLPSETTKIKYIIRNPSTNKPIKIIKMSSAPKKVLKMIPLPQKASITNKFTKPPKSSFPHAEALHDLEKEQEMLAEGRVPQFDSESLKHNDDVVSGHIGSEFGGDWRPLSTAKPQAMSDLHTSIIAEQLPEPEKIVYESEANEVSFDFHKPKNGYEVTEHSAEESLAVPYAQTHYQNSRGFIPIRKAPPHRQQQQKHNARVGLTHVTTSTTTTTTSTTESPNYPAAFLKKQRVSKLLEQHLKNLGLNDSSVAFDNSKEKAIKQAFVLRTKSENWPILGPTALLPTTIKTTTTTTKHKTRKSEQLTQPTSTDNRLTQKTPKKLTTPKPRDIRQRGSIKFGDKLSELYK